MDAEFRSFKSGNIKTFVLMKNTPRVWSRVRLLYSNVRVFENKTTFDLVFNAPEDLLSDRDLEDLFRRFMSGPADLGLDDNDLNISVIPNRVFNYKASAL